MNSVNFIELKKIEREILKGISIKDTLNEITKTDVFGMPKTERLFSSIKTIAAFDISFSGKKVICSGIVFSFPDLNILETKTKISEELMPYSPNTIIFREGPPIIGLFRELETKPDVLFIDGNGKLHPNKTGLASYVGVMLNKPSIGITKELIYGNLEEDRIIFNSELKGYALKTKEFANPIFVTPGHNISIEKAVEIVKQTLSSEFKLPVPLHLAHKETNKIKRSLATPSSA